MPADDWWTEAVERFGLDTSADDSIDADPTSPSIDDAGDATQPPRRRRRRRRRRRLLVDWLVVSVVALGSALVLRTFVVEQFAVEGESMLGTLHSGDRVFVNKLSYEAHKPRRGDVVVLKDVNESIEVRDLIKRVIALPGETVEYRHCELFINGDLVNESYLDPSLVGSDSCGDPQLPVKVAAEHVFVMGDNRRASLDSRTPIIGQVSYDNLIGRAFVVIWPASDWRWL